MFKNMFRKIMFCALFFSLCVLALFVFFWPLKAKPPLSHEEAFVFCMNEIARQRGTNTLGKYVVHPRRGDGYWLFLFDLSPVEPGNQIMVTVKDSGKTSSIDMW